MRHPVWILNSILVVLLAMAIVFAFFSQQEIPERESIKPDARAAGLKKESTKINIRKIYEYDLFNTYQKEILTPKEPTLVTPLPEAPRPAPVTIPAQPKPQFLEPLQITLKGIMATSDDSQNAAILLDNKTKRETVYRVGEKVEDAQLIRILKNKIIFLRSNGQQEVFYLRPQDAQLDPSFAKNQDWKDSIKKIAANNYQINPPAFIEKIPNLGEFIDALDLTTVYKQGESIGLRVGSTDTIQLAQALGLYVGDIITDIDDIPATNTENRMAIFRHITELPEDSTVKVRLQRNGQRFILLYKLAEFTDSQKTEKSPAPGVVSEFGLREEQRKILEKKHSFAPTLQEIKQQERKNMLQKGSSQRVEQSQSNNDE